MPYPDHGPTEENLASLQDVPISRSPFEAGFYRSGRGLKYRSGFWSAWALPASYGCFFFAFDLILKYAGLSMAYSALKEGKWEGLLGLVLAFAVNAERLISCTFWPPSAIDSAQRIVKWGRLLTAKTPFDQIAAVSVVRSRRKGLERKMNGTNIRLVSFGAKRRTIPVAYLYPWEEDRTEYLVQALERLLGKELQTEYVADE